MAIRTDKRMRRRVLERALRFMATAVLAKYRPKIVGVTGSVGKSSTKEAIALVLGSRFTVGKSEGNLNNEVGAPLAILGADPGGASLLGWAMVAIRFLRLMLFPSHYPSVLVLEMGVDCPGDMDYLLSFIPLQVGVVTRVGTSHIEYFGTIGNIAREKGKIVSHLPTDGYAVLNADDERVLKMQEKTRSVVLTYGFSPAAAIRADNLIFHGRSGTASGWSFKLDYDGTTIPVRLPGVLARHHIEDALAAVAVGVAFGQNLVDIATALERFEPLPGRLRPLRGVGGSLLLDDSYNASPASVEAALRTLGDLDASRKVVILGDMLELGSESVASHRALAEAIISSGAAIVLGVGERTGETCDELGGRGFRGEVRRFSDPYAAADAARTLVREGDAVLIKGSQGVRMELVTEALLADPLDRNRLCRQNAHWRSRSFRPPEEWTAKTTAVEPGRN